MEGELKILTLGDMVNDYDGNIRIKNECNEVLLTCLDVQHDVCPLGKLLKRELLDRQVLRFMAEGDYFVIKIAGVEDVE